MKTAATRTTDPVEKHNLHPRNLHRDQYEFKLLCKAYPELKPFVRQNEFHIDSVDFSDAKAVRALNRALLAHFYNIQHWDFPASFLCPPVPGRADYIHYLADLLAGSNGGQLPAGEKIRVLDLGTGANCIYPILGKSIYDWNFAGTDIDPRSVEAARKIVSLNPQLSASIEIRQQPASANILKGIIGEGELFDLTICNPPFHSSLDQAMAGSALKWKNLGVNKSAGSLLNFGGQQAELYCEGGESTFIRRMVKESMLFKQQCCWFSTLVSKKENLEGIYKAISGAGAVATRTIEMSQGQKISRFVAWTFLDDTAMQAWKELRW